MREAAAAAMLAAEDAARAEAKKQAKAAEKGASLAHPTVRNAHGSGANTTASPPPFSSPQASRRRPPTHLRPPPPTALRSLSSSGPSASPCPFQHSLSTSLPLAPSPPGSCPCTAPSSTPSSSRPRRSLQRRAAPCSFSLPQTSRAPGRCGTTVGRVREVRFLNSPVSIPSMSLTHLYLLLLFPGWAGVKAKWASGTEPAWVARLSQHPSTTSSTTRAATSPVSFSSSASHAPPAGGPGEIPLTPSFSFDPFAAVAPAPEPPKPTGTSSLDYESATLLRMRQAERARLEQEIRDAEGEDE